MGNFYRVLSLLFFVVTVTGCSGKPETGPAEVKWDRDACERCRMVLSDRNHSAQVRYQPAGAKRTKVLKFDDVGCAVVWLQDKPWKDAGTTQIWTTDHRNGGWIDAKSATYVKGQTTPMEYGLGAQPEPIDGGLSFAEAEKHILYIEEKFNIHGVDLLKRLEEQRGKREPETQHNHGTEK